MKIKVTQWSISTLKKRLETINDQPEYQRGQVWGKLKQSLLNESILRGIDLPKIYLRKLKNKHFKYEVADGQQRLSSITSFLDDRIKLPSGQVGNLQLSKFNSSNLSGKVFSKLDKVHQEQYLNTKLTISLIENASEDDIRLLFGRLQEGISLNPAEKRNAIISSIGKHIDSIALNHSFFENCKIPSSRFKHIDYLAHAFALIVYNNQYDLKANLLEKMYYNTTYSITIDTLKKVDAVLCLMERLDSLINFSIKNKFTFIDLFWFFYQNDSSKIDLKSFAPKLEEFESDRLTYRKSIQNIKSVARLTVSEKEDLTKYIVAYDRSGSTKENLQLRHDIFNRKFKKYL